LSYATVSSNSASSGSGVYTRGAVTLQSTLIANSCATAGSGAVSTSSAYNLGTDSTCVINGVNNNLVNASPGLDILGNNGGLTQTHGLLSTSPAVNVIPQGTNGCATTVSTDQRDLWRAQSANCDIGAVEYFSNVCSTYDAASPQVPLDIPPTGTSGTTTSQITIATGVPVSDVNVLNVKGTHELISDLKFTLKKGAISAQLYSSTCGGRDFNMSFDDEAVSSIFPCPPTLGGVYKPSNLLSAFDNPTNSTGTWELSIEDGAANNKGQLTAWTLEVCTGTVIWINDASVSEAAATLDFTVTLSKASTVPVYVNYTTVNGTATAGSDYTATSGLLTIPAGSTSAVIGVPVLDDTFDETNETFTLKLSNPINTFLLDDEGEGKIADDDPSVAGSCTSYPSSNVGSSVKIPSSGTGGISGGISDNMTSTLSIAATDIIGDLNVLNLSGKHAAVGDLKFTLTSPGNLSAHLFGPVCGTEDDFALNLDDEASTSILPCPPTGGGTYIPREDLSVFGGSAANGTWTLKIEDSYSSNSGNLDSWSLQICKLLLSINDITVNESDGSATFTVSMNGVSKNTVTLNYSTADGTALAGSDYTASSGTVTIPAGSTSATITVPLINDSVAENCEEFYVNLSGASNVVITDTQGKAVIEDDDSGGGLSTTPSWSYTGSGGEWAGVSAAFGDFNGDGKDDLLVGADGYNNGAGRVLVYKGSDTGLSATATSINGDQASAHFGHAVAAVNVNGDAYDDALISAHAYDNGELNEGRVYLYYGSNSGLNATPGWTGESNAASALFGFALANAGDVDNDGFEDFLVGAPNYSGAFSNQGAAYVYYGSASGPGATPWKAEGDLFIAWLGWSVAGAGDVNKDGYADVIIGSPGYNMLKGAAYVYHGSSTGLGASAAWTVLGTAGQLGISVSGAGDVNGDGYADAAVGTPGYSSSQAQEGQVRVYHGSSGGLSASPDWAAESDSAFAQFGISVTGVGDTGGDGYGDILIGAVYQGLSNGIARAYYGSGSGLAATPGWSVTGAQAASWYGAVFAGNGDANGNGVNDIAVAAPRYNAAKDGFIEVYLGQGGGGSCP
jgi:subtilisin-like proprotein convertase family protein